MKVTSSIKQVFDAYADWYVKKYVPTLIEDDPVEGMKELRANRWDHPLRGLRALEAAAIAKLEPSAGFLPSAYRELLTTVGAGTLLAASDDEPAPFRILRPAAVKKARKAAMACFSDEDKAVAAKKKRLDLSKMLPFMADGEDDEDEAFWVMLTLQTKNDDRVVIVERDHENGRPVGRKTKSFSEFVARWVACAKKREPLNPFDGL
ncbi:hypothetical protein AKJ09_05688 [Labilithrix luteola]|uniref:Knr4/Smi1-like domain-containing protein n=1 Tax=Labilithrix luteola TaxID=1391654 RepID=A0A0K1Q0T5_9BACT|nr:SMI1/KNR4 family protein [Labilithrix luteola]AKU99024.1 hypothetical protein AKJ09_05688 [Labilithrix luteola]